MWTREVVKTDLSVIDAVVELGKEQDLRFLYQLKICFENGVIFSPYQAYKNFFKGVMSKSTFYIKWRRVIGLKWIVPRGGQFRLISSHKLPSTGKRRYKKLTIQSLRKHDILKHALLLDNQNRQLHRAKCNKENLQEEFLTLPKNTRIRGVHLVDPNGAIMSLVPSTAGFHELAHLTVRTVSKMFGLQSAMGGSHILRRLGAVSRRRFRKNESATNKVSQIINGERYERLVSEINLENVFVSKSQFSRITQNLILRKAREIAVPRNSKERKLKELAVDVKINMYFNDLIG